MEKRRKIKKNSKEKNDDYPQRRQDKIQKKSKKERRISESPGTVFLQRVPRTNISEERAAKNRGRKTRQGRQSTAYPFLRKPKKSTRIKNKGIYDEIGGNVLGNAVPDTATGGERALESVHLSKKIEKGVWRGSPVLPA